MILRAEHALAPLDAVRGAALRFLAGVPAMRTVLARRATRVPIGLTAHASAAFGIALLAPSLSLVLAPILLGVPHLASDVRHLVLRRALPRYWSWSIFAFAGVLVAISIVREVSPALGDPTLLQHFLASSWIVMSAIGGGILGGFRKSSLFALFGAGVIAYCSIAHPGPFRLILAHAHNLVAIGIWLFLFPRTGLIARLTAAFIVLAGAWLASGSLLVFTVHHGILSFFGLHLFAAADWLAPGVPDPRGIGLACAFAFLQSVHYGIWLWAIPQADANCERTTTFRMSWRSLNRDFTPTGLAFVVVVAFLVLVAGATAPLRTQTWVLSVGLFHGWLELAMLCFFLARDGFRPATAFAGGSACGTSQSRAFALRAQDGALAVPTPTSVRSLAISFSSPKTTSAEPP